MIGAAPGSDAPATEQLIIDGWGFALLPPTSVQPDNGAGLTKGIIGLVNKGRPRKPDDWGALRAWAWGASRALDHLETNRAVNAKAVGIDKPDERHPQSQDDQCSTNNHNVTPRQATGAAYPARSIARRSAPGQSGFSAIFRKRKWSPGRREAVRATCQVAGDQCEGAIAGLSAFSRS